MVILFAENVKQIIAVGLWFDSEMYEQFETRYDDR
jgi:hypothetical protein